MKIPVPVTLRPLAVEDLQEGNEYFKVLFVDEEMKIPIVKALCFEGLDASGKAMFRDLDPLAGDETTGVRIFMEETPSVYGLEHVLELLAECCARRSR